MSNRKQRIKNRNTYNALMGQLEVRGKLNRPPCSNCGKPGAHFVPPSFGEEGFFSCERTRQVTQSDTFKIVYGETPNPPEQPEIDEAIEEALKECFPEKDNDSV